MNTIIEKEGDLILLRGLPGSGKSLLAEIILLHPSGLDPEVLSTDDFFTDEYGNYNFDPEKVIEAENYCHFRCSERMRQKKARIVVANVFANESDMDIYFNMAERYNYRVHTVIVENRHGSESTHENNNDKLKELKELFEIKL